MHWTSLIKQFRLTRGLNQAGMAALCGVQQATISRWESGKHFPDRATRNRLRAIISVQDSKLDQAIIRSVRYSHTCAGLTLDLSRVIEASVGVCRLQAACRADVIEISPSEWFRHVRRAPDVDRANQRALQNGDLLAIHAKMELPIFRTRGKLPIAATFTPLWLSDGTFLIRWDASVLPLGEYQGQSVTAITRDNMFTEL
jgi:transcriptional regulator with XRE-family HTH domain